jgi:hypothetical protein
MSDSRRSTDVIGRSMHVGMPIGNVWEEWRPSRTTRLVSALAALGCGAIVIPLAIGIATAGTGADVSGAVGLATVFAVLAVVSAIQAFRLRLTVGPEGLIVRNFRTTQIPWSEFQDCSSGVWGIWIRRAGRRPVIALAVDKQPVAWLIEQTRADVVVTAIDGYAHQHAA